MTYFYASLVAGVDREEPRNGVEISLVPSSENALTKCNPYPKTLTREKENECSISLGKPSLTGNVSYFFSNFRSVSRRQILDIRIEDARGEHVMITLKIT